MADSAPLTIEGEISYDEESPYVGDPFAVEVTVRDASGSEIQADVAVSLVDMDGEQEDLAEGESADTFSLEASTPTYYEVYASATSGGMEGVSKVGFVEVLGLPEGVTVLGAVGTLLGQINFDFSEPDYSSTAATL